LEHLLQKIKFLFVEQVGMYNIILYLLMTRHTNFQHRH